jgi:phenylpropionate dioxygenase-like ring-hydroxylating dioxygenase large terminal subunit
MTLLEEPTAERSTPRAAPKTGTLVTDIAELRAFWYPVAQLDALADGPVLRRLLGVDLVIWSPAPGEVRAAPDRCPHRDASLASGRVEDGCLVCPYHGWEFGEDGKAVHLPQVDDGAPIPPRARLEVAHAAAHWGWAWVALDEPTLPLPELAEIDDPAWRVIHDPESEWHCSSLHLLDNNLDPAHVAFVHAATFGAGSPKKVPLADVERTATGLRTELDLPVAGRHGEDDKHTVRSTVTDIWGPALMISRIRYPDGLVHIMLKATTPVDAKETRQLQIIVRNDTEADRPAEDIVAFDMRTWVEDKAVLERCYPDFHLDVTANVHLRVDRPSIEYRRFLADVADGSFRAAQPQ